MLFQECVVHPCCVFAWQSRHTGCLVWKCHPSPQYAQQHTATYCNKLQHTATHCSTLQHTAGHTATYCNKLQHTATHCSTLQHTAGHCCQVVFCSSFSFVCLHESRCVCLQVQGPLRECPGAGRFRATPLLHNTCVCS